MINYTHLLHLSTHMETLQNLKYLYVCICISIFKFLAPLTCMWMSSEAEQRTAAVADEDVFYLKQGEAALEEALKIVEAEDGWTLETDEVMIVCSLGVQISRMCSHRTSRTSLSFRRTEMWSIVKFWRATGRFSDSRPNSTRLRRNFRTSCSSEWRRCTTGTPASAASK